MKILHTADWHIGKKLHKQYLYRDFELFINWLVALIEREGIDVILISGDLFDLANPAAEARKQYYRALARLRGLQCKIIITGGNHDSPTMLDAPREILEELNVTIIGGLPERVEDYLIPLKDEDGNTVAVVAAIPYLRDSDLRASNEDAVYENRVEAIRKGIETIFTAAAKACENLFPYIPAIAMGHLYAAGIEPSESERDIQIGNQAAFQANRFGEYFSYVALGHIHKPQRVSAAVPTFYSGSPLALSFSERQDEKRVLLLDTKNGFEPQSISVPTFRRLLKIIGSLGSIKNKLGTLSAEGQLTNLIEVAMLEDNFDANLIAQLDELVTSFNVRGMEIVKHRATFKNRQQETGQLFTVNQHLEDLKPQEVFAKLLEQHSYSEDVKDKVAQAFSEITEQVQNSTQPL
ncbi:MAG: exonuclease SbcCD subunit D C-terminal domain-containing protein [Leeuwenhoekiella sp.]